MSLNRAIYLQRLERSIKLELDAISNGKYNNKDELNAQFLSINPEAASERSESDESRETDEEQSSSEDETERAATPPATTENMEVEFQQVSPRKAAKHPGQVKTTPTIRVDNRFQSLADTPTPTGTKEHPATIDLKPTTTPFLRKLPRSFLAQRISSFLDTSTSKPPRKKTDKR
ncbi:hypothetical protein AVEN_75388-1 [Araneus ventricosus]|uniref:Uncharacterized protein n=1 Tax=Araneus ventricosus TaxID=182803 RepID=A0A4Y2HWY3_ARAVE|nr:hypothetical protein AVEN_75388-1 [Araneus ventricosus]